MNLINIFFNNLHDLILFNYFLSIFLFFIFLTIYSCFSLPGLIIFFALSGYLFGVFIGYFISIISISIGSLIFIVLLKSIFYNFSKKYFLRYIDIMNKYISKSSFEYLIIFRMIPGPPLFLQNFILSYIKVNRLKLLMATLIGFTPIVLFSVLIGNKISDISNFYEFDNKKIFTLDFFLIIFVLIIIIFVRILYKKKPS